MNKTVKNILIGAGLYIAAKKTGVLKSVGIGSSRRTFQRYKQNLDYDGNYIYSYGTKVAEITPNSVKPLGWWSVTTSKHINYAAKELGLPVKK